MELFPITLPDGEEVELEGIPENAPDDLILQLSTALMRRDGLRNPIDVDVARRLPSGIRYSTKIGDEYVSEEGGKAKQTFRIASEANDQQRKRIAQKRKEYDNYETPFVSRLVERAEAAGDPLTPEEVEALRGELRRGFDEAGSNPTGLGKRIGANFKEGVKRDTVWAVAQGLATDLPVASGLRARREQLQREADIRSGKLRDAMSEPTIAEFPDEVLAREIADIDAQLSDPTFVAEQRTRRLERLRGAAFKLGAYEGIPDSEGVLETAAAGLGRLGAQVTDPTNILGSLTTKAAATPVRIAGQSGRQIAEAVGASARRGMAENLPSALASEPLVQAGNIAAAMQDDLSPTQAAANVALGTAAGGALRSFGDTLRGLVDLPKDIRVQRIEAEKARLAEVAKAAETEAAATRARELSAKLDEFEAKAEEALNTRAELEAAAARQAEIEDLARQVDDEFTAREAADEEALLRNQAVEMRAAQAARDAEVVRQADADIAAGRQTLADEADDLKALRESAARGETARLQELEDLAAIESSAGMATARAESGGFGITQATQPLAAGISTTVSPVGFGVAEAIAAPRRVREVPPIRVSANRPLSQTLARQLQRVPYDDLKRGLPGKKYASLRQETLRRLTGQTYSQRDATSARTNEALRARYPGTDEEFGRQIYDAAKSNRKGDPMAFQRMPLSRHGESDFLNEIAELGGIRRPRGESSKGGEWDGASERGLDKDRWVRRLLRSPDSSAQQVDTLIQELNGTGRYNFASPDEFWEKVNSAVRRRNMSDEEIIGSPPDAATDPKAFDAWMERAEELRMKKQEAEAMEAAADSDGRYFDDGSEPPPVVDGSIDPNNPFAVARGNLGGSIAEPLAGAAIGYGLGETEEEKRRFAMLGGGLGIGASLAARGLIGRLQGSSGAIKVAPGSAAGGATPAGGTAARATTPPAGAPTPSAAPATGAAAVATPPPIERVQMNFADRGREIFQDSWFRVVRMLKQSGAKIDDATNPYDAEMRIHGRTGYRIEKVNEAAKNITKSMIGASERLGTTVERMAVDVNNFLVARHAPQRNAVLGTKAAGITDAEAKAVLDDIRTRGAYDEVEKIADEWAAVNRQTLDILLEGEVISRDTYDALRKKYPDHVPLNRIMPDTELDDVTDALSRGGPGNNIITTGLKRAKGSDLEVMDVRGNIMANFKEAVTRAEKNRLNLATYELVKRNPTQLGSLITIRNVPIPATRSDGTPYLKPFDPKEPVVRFRVKGKPKELLFSDPELAKVFQGLNMDQIPTLIRWILPLTNLVARLATTYYAEFAPPNWIRDIQDLGVNLTADLGIKNSRKIATESRQSLRDVFRYAKGDRGPRTALYQQMMEDGGTTGGISMSTRTSELANLTRLEQKLGPGMNVAKFGKVLDVLNEWNRVFEDSNRLTAYKIALQAGLSREKAAVIAKNATINFNKKGTSGPILNALYMFSNVGIQGQARTLRSFYRNPKVAAGTLATIGAGLMAVKQINSAQNEDWRSYISDFELRSTYPIVIGNKEDGTPDIIKVPVSWSLRPFYAIMNVITDIGDPSVPEINLKKSMGDFGSAMMDTFNPLGGDDIIQNLTPTVADPIFDIARNKSWSGGTIKPETVRRGPASERAADLPAWQVYWEDTPQTLKGSGAVETAKALSKLGVEVSPESLIYAFDFITGGAGRTVAKTADSVAMAFGDEPIDVTRFPFISRFIRRVTPERAQAIAERRSSGFESAREAVQEQAIARLSRGEQVKQAYDEIEMLDTPDKKRAALRAILHADPTLVQDLIEYGDRIELSKTSNERMLGQLAIENGNRAREVYRQLMKFEDPKRRAEVMGRWIEAGVITELVAKQMEVLHAANSGRNAPAPE